MKVSYRLHYLKPVLTFNDTTCLSTLSCHHAWHAVVKTDFRSATSPLYLNGGRGDPAVSSSSIKSREIHRLSCAKLLIPFSLLSVFLYISQLPVIFYSDPD
ncbi:hypothetical protein CHARACLAT_016018 [Characodon lateralis]|uniref:Uncharacterized protein n=1 Tax=Characodon lateralis TaxID=208331 RepID=A0ABU7CRN5_9TELE|nr:hypothetical protein [Characodon lateralis]